MSAQRLKEQTRKCLLVFAGFFTFLYSMLVFAQGEISPHIQVLSSSCAACHGTHGNSVGGTPVLASLDRAHFITQMMAFRTGERSSTVMYRHAKGLTQAEISDLADFFAMQPREVMRTPPASHAEEP